jgi:hypothetical protein
MYQNNADIAGAIYIYSWVDVICHDVISRDAGKGCAIAKP